MTFKQFRRVRIAYHFSRFSYELGLQKVRDAYPTQLPHKEILAKHIELEEEIQAGMKELGGMLS